MNAIIYNGRYEVTSEGKVFSNLGRSKRLLKGKTCTNGYIGYTIRINGKSVFKYGHRLVAEAFIPNPLNKPTVNHKYCDKTNNHVDGLEWATHKENIVHARDNNLTKTKINMKIANQIRIETGTHKNIAIKYGISRRLVTYIKNNKRWNA